MWGVPFGGAFIGQVGRVGQIGQVGRRTQWVLADVAGVVASCGGSLMWLVWWLAVVASWGRPTCPICPTCPTCPIRYRPCPIKAPLPSRHPHPLLSPLLFPILSACTRHLLSNSALG